MGFCQDMLSVHWKVHLQKCVLFMLFKLVLLIMLINLPSNLNRYTINDRSLGRLLNQITTTYKTELQLWKVSSDE